MANEEDVFEITVSARGGNDYCVEARCGGHPPASAEVMLPQDLFDHLANLQIAVTTGASTRGGGAATLPRDAQPRIIADFGTRLFDFMFPRDVFTLYRKARAEAEACGRRVRIAIRLSQHLRHVAGLPWEALFDRDKREYLATSGKVALARVAQENVVARRASPMLRVLVFVANARDDGIGNPLDLIIYEQETAWIEEALKPLKRRKQLKYTFAKGSFAELKDKLYERGQAFDIVHFIGHGGFEEGRDEGYLVFLRKGTTVGQRIYAQDLSNIIDKPDGPRLVVLNSCLGGASGASGDIFSSTAGQLALSDIPCIVAMQFRITNEAAQAFSAEFYKWLAEGQPVQEAVRLARIEMRSAGPEWVTPVLYTRSRDGYLFDLLAPGAAP